MVNVEVEIGDESNRQKIVEELESVLKVVDMIDPPIRLDGVIVPKDFEGRVNRLQDRADFKVKRGGLNNSVEVYAKIVDADEKTYIVLSPAIYEYPIDTKIRFFYLFHEIVHLRNKNYLSKIESISVSTNFYLNGLYYAYDEYQADRVAYSMVDELSMSSAMWDKFSKSMLVGYFDYATNPEFPHFIQQKIDEFRYHADIDQFMNSVKESIYTITISFTHGFANLHQHPEEEISFRIPESIFINKDAFDYFDFLKTKFINREYALEDGIVLITNFFKHFGLVMEDRPEGGWIEVLDIL